MVALINQGGATIRWLIGGLSTIAITVFYLPGCDCDVEHTFTKILTYSIVFGLLCFVLALSGYLYGRSQKKFRLRKTELLSARIRELELVIDPNRSSSGLQPSGETHPGDRLP